MNEMDKITLFLRFMTARNDWVMWVNQEKNEELEDPVTAVHAENMTLLRVSFNHVGNCSARAAKVQELFWLLVLIVTAQVMAYIRSRHVPFVRGAVLCISIALVHMARKYKN